MSAWEEKERRLGLCLCGEFVVCGVFVVVVGSEGSLGRTAYLSTFSRKCPEVSSIRDACAPQGTKPCMILISVELTLHICPIVTITQN